MKLFLPLLYLLAFQISVEASDNRFPPIKAIYNYNGQAPMFDSGDMHSITQKNGLKISWISKNGSRQTWFMKPEYFQDQVECGEFQCDADSPVPCYGKCICSPPVVHLYDSRDKKLYFSVALDFGSNVPHVVFLADLNRKRVSHLFDTYGSGLDSFVISPSGLFLACLTSWHGSACAAGNNMEIYDTQKHIVLKPAVKPNPDLTMREYAFYRSVEWLSNSKLRLRGRSWNCQGVDGDDQIPIEAIVDLPGVK